MAATISTHNGKWTVTSMKTGEHRTFRIRTQKADATFCPGARIISLLVGPNNVMNFKGFGFVNENGKINVYKKFLGTQYEKLARMVENLDEHEKLGRVKVQAETTCRKCNKCLTDPVSIETGIGPICAGRE